MPAALLTASRGAGQMRPRPLGTPAGTAPFCLSPGTPVRSEAKAHRPFVSAQNATKQANAAALQLGLRGVRPGWAWNHPVQQRRPPGPAQRPPGGALRASTLPLHKRPGLRTADSQTRGTRRSTPDGSWKARTGNPHPTASSGTTPLRHTPTSRRPGRPCCSPSCPDTTGPRTPPFMPPHPGETLPPRTRHASCCCGL